MTTKKRIKKTELTMLQSLAINIPCVYADGGKNSRWFFTRFFYALFIYTFLLLHPYYFRNSGGIIVKIFIAIFILENQLTQKNKDRRIINPTTLLFFTLN